MLLKYLTGQEVKTFIKIHVTTNDILRTEECFQIILVSIFFPDHHQPDIRDSTDL